MRKKRDIVVHMEDIGIHQEVVKHHLSDRGFQVWQSGSPEDFLQRLRALSPAELERTLILLDVNIGANHQAGIQVYQAIRKEISQTVPVLFVTVWAADRLEIALPEIRDRIRVDVLSKPFGLRQLDSAMEAVVEQDGDDHEED